MNLQNIRSIYFIGIGGIGMSALARYMKSKGKFVYGYDKTQTDLTLELLAEGIEIAFHDEVENLPKEIDLVVYTPAIPSTHKQLNYLKSIGKTLVKRSELLEEITRSSFTIAVAGTHGKTTTTTLIAHILKRSGYDCTAFLGGISVNYNTNFISGANDVVVVEADEYDRSFLHLHPDIAVITSCDADHLDIYGNAGSVQQSFVEFATMVKPGGTLILKKNISIESHLQKQDPVSYSLTDMNADYFSFNNKLDEGLFVFDVMTPFGEQKEFLLGIPGQHNVENAVAAVAVATQLMIQENEIADALTSFRGVKRRFEYVIKNEKLVFIDDYAHHPEEIKAFLTAVKNIYPNKKITCIFQPHLFSRTKDFADQFAESLSVVDELILLPIYPARELPMDGVSSEMLLEKCHAPIKKVLTKDELLQAFNKTVPQLLLTIGAGDIDNCVLPLKNILLQTLKPQS